MYLGTIKGFRHDFGRYFGHYSESMHSARTCAEMNPSQCPNDFPRKKGIFPSFTKGNVFGHYEGFIRNYFGHYSGGHYSGSLLGGSLGGCRARLGGLDLRGGGFGLQRGV